MSQASAEVAARFRALADHPELPRLLAAPRVDRAGDGLTLGTVCLLGVLALAGLLVSILFFAFCPPLGLLPLALVGFGGYALVNQLGARPERSTPVRLAALVVDERAKLEGDAGASARTRHRATLEFADGSRRELEVSGAAADPIRPGDMGVAELEGDALVAFTRIEV